MHIKTSQAPTTCKLRTNHEPNPQTEQPNHTPALESADAHRANLSSGCLTTCVLHDKPSIPVDALVLVRPACHLSCPGRRNCPRPHCGWQEFWQTTASAAQCSSPCYNSRTAPAKTGARYISTSSLPHLHPFSWRWQWQVPRSYHRKGCSVPSEVTRKVAQGPRDKADDVCRDEEDVRTSNSSTSCGCIAICVY